MNQAETHRPRQHSRLRIRLITEEGIATNHIFGPVPSRRLGRSLGVDVVPLKTCNWNCVYCQLGRTIPLTSQRADYVPRQLILEEFLQALEAGRLQHTDWVTLVGSGEPTLHLHFGWILRQIRKLTTKPIAVITNGSLLHLAEVQRSLACADAVLPSLGAGTPALFRLLNRPHPSSTFDRLLEGLVSFRRQYSGRFWLEVMLVHRLNDNAAALQSLARAIARIRPDEVHLSLPVRPPADPWVQPARAAALARAVRILGSTARILPPIPEGIELPEGADILDSILDVIARHPMEERELAGALGSWGSSDVASALARLQASGRAQPVKQGKLRYWSASGIRYGRSR